MCEIYIIPSLKEKVILFLHPLPIQPILGLTQTFCWTEAQTWEGWGKGAYSEIRTDVFFPLFFFFLSSFPFFPFFTFFCFPFLNTGGGGQLALKIPEYAPDIEYCWFNIPVWKAKKVIVFYFYFFGVRGFKDLLSGIYMPFFFYFQERSGFGESRDSLPKTKSILVQEQRL